MAYTTIKDPSAYFQTKLYTGTGASNSQTVGFQPDFCWFKGRNQAYNHYLFDSVRGVNKAIYSSLANAETTQTDTLMSFDSNGFTLGTDSANGEMNSSGNTFASWNWRANGAGSANTDGSISSTVSVNTTSGFSIVSYTGTGANGTIGHGLGQAPDMIIVKRRDGADGWKVYNSPRGATKYLQLHTTDAEGTLSSQWNDTEPTSSVFSVGTAGDINGSGGRTYIAYCFANKKGFSKIGSYTGNGSTDGTFVYTGFKPAWFMTKRTDSANSWVMFDNKRSSSGGFNEIDYSVNANSAGAEETSNTSSDVDFCSNGIKITEDNGAINESGGSYIYMAFAEEPLVGDNPATAR